MAVLRFHLALPIKITQLQTKEQMQGSICQEYQLSSVSVPITYLRTGKMTAAWTTGSVLDHPTRTLQEWTVQRMRTCCGSEINHLVKGMKGTMVCLFPSGREAHEEPALDLCAEAELRRTGVDSGSHENACLSPVGVQLTDTPWCALSLPSAHDKAISPTAALGQQLHMEKEVLSYEILDSSNRQLPTLLHTLSMPRGQTVLSPASFPTSSDSLLLFFLRGLLPASPACLMPSWHTNAFSEKPHMLYGDGSQHTGINNLAKWSNPNLSEWPTVR